MTVDYADLAIIDISKAETEQGRAALAVEVRDALLKHGFFYVVNHGYSEAEVRRPRPIKSSYHCLSYLDADGSHV